MKIKNILFTVSLLIITASISAQEYSFPSKLSYQAVVRDPNGELIINQQMNVKIYILKGSPEGISVFIENHTELTTNENGLLTLMIGNGNTVAGDINGINWQDDKYFAKVDIAPEGDNVYSISSTTQLLAVPYSFYSKDAGYALSADYENLLNLPDLSVFATKDMAGGSIINLADPVEKQSAVTKNYTDSIIAGLVGRIELLEQELGLPGPDDVVDVDGNVYKTVEINGRHWFTSNLKTTRFQDGTMVETGLDNIEWGYTLEPAYTIYPHDMIEGIDSDDEMADMFGLLYNWYTVGDNRNICPVGWKVPSKEEWDDLVHYVYGDASKYKSCRQQNSPLGGECTTDEHPRWLGLDDEVYGTDDYGFSVLPAGTVNNGMTPIPIDPELFGINTGFWSSTIYSELLFEAFSYHFHAGLTEINSHRMSFNFGYAIRCIKEE